MSATLRGRHGGGARGSGCARGRKYGPPERSEGVGLVSPHRDRLKRGGAAPKRASGSHGSLAFAA
jgi:hypothetical protein